MPTTGWWRILPVSLHAYIYLGRFDRPIGWWLLLLPGWWVIPIGAPSVVSMWWLMALFLAGAIITRAAGCIINDLWDRRLDQQVERTLQRPLASGAVSVGAAFIFLAILGIAICPLSNSGIIFPLELTSDRRVSPIWLILLDGAS